VRFLSVGPEDRADLCGGKCSVVEYSETMFTQYSTSAGICITNQDERFEPSTRKTHAMMNRYTFPARMTTCLIVSRLEVAFGTPVPVLSSLKEEDFDDAQDDDQV